MIFFFNLFMIIFYNFINFTGSLTGFQHSLFSILNNYQVQRAIGFLYNDQFVIALCVYILDTKEIILSLNIFYIFCKSWICLIGVRFCSILIVAYINISLPRLKQWVVCDTTVSDYCFCFIVMYADKFCSKHKVEFNNQT